MKKQTYILGFVTAGLVGAMPLSAHAQAMIRAAVEPPATPAALVTPPPAFPSPAPSVAEAAVRNMVAVSPATAPSPSPVQVLLAPPPALIETPEPKSPELPASAEPAAAPAPAPAAALLPKEDPQPRAAPSAVEKRSIRSEPAEPKTAETPAPASATSMLPSGLGNLGQVLAALSIVIGLIFIGKALMRKFVPGAKTAGGKGVIEILARHPLTKNQSIVLVRIGSQIVALNQGKESSESVLVINDATEVAKIIGQIEGRNPDSIQAGFNNLLANARMDLEQHPDPDAEQKSIDPEGLDEQLEEMAAAKRQLMELRQHVRSVRDRMPSA